MFNLISVADLYCFDAGQESGSDFLFYCVVLWIQISQVDPTAGQDPDLVFLSVNFFSFFRPPAFCLDMTENGSFGRVDKKEDSNNIFLIQIYEPPGLKYF